MAEEGGGQPGPWPAGPAPGATRACDHRASGRTAGRSHTQPDRTPGHRLGRVFVAVGHRAGQAAEEGARLDPSAVVLDVRHLDDRAGSPVGLEDVDLSSSNRFICTGEASRSPIGRGTSGAEPVGGGRRTRPRGGPPDPDGRCHRRPHVMSWLWSAVDLVAGVVRVGAPAWRGSRTGGGHSA